MKFLRTMLLGIVALGGCASQPYVTGERLARGKVFVLSGAEGRSVLTDAIARGLDDGGIDCAIEIFPWTSPWGGPLYNLRAETRNRRQAVKLADAVDAYLQEHPGRTVYLVGQSSGAAIAAWAAEALGADTRVEGIVMIAPSLSPQYTLDEALLNCDRGIVNFYSQRDVMLVVGTPVAGTMDGRHAISAGGIGFSVADGGAQPAGYEKLYQIAWREQMAASGNLGGHLSSSAAGYVAAYVAPLLKAPAWNQQVMDTIAAGKGFAPPRPEAAESTGPQTNP